MLTKIKTQSSDRPEVTIGHAFEDLALVGAFVADNAAVVGQLARGNLQDGKLELGPGLIIQERDIAEWGVDYTANI